MGIIIDIHPTLLQPELTHIVTLGLRAEEVMLELGKLGQKSRKFLSAHQVGCGGALEVPVLERHHGAQGLGVLQEEHRLGVQRLQGGQEGGALGGDDLLHGGQGRVEAREADGAGLRALVQVIRCLQPHGGPPGAQARGQPSQGVVGGARPAQGEVACVLSIKNTPCKRNIQGQYIDTKNSKPDAVNTLPDPRTPSTTASATMTPSPPRLTLYGNPGWNRGGRRRYSGITTLLADGTKVTRSDKRFLEIVLFLNSYCLKSSTHRSHLVSSPGDTSSCSSLLRVKAIPYCMFWKKSVFWTERSLYIILRNLRSVRMSGVPTWKKYCHFQTIQEARIEQVFSIHIVSFFKKPNTNIQ